MEISYRFPALKKNYNSELFSQTLLFLHKLLLFHLFSTNPSAVLFSSLTSVNFITYSEKKVAAISNSFSQTIAQYHHQFAADLI